MGLCYFAAGDDDNVEDDYAAGDLGGEDDLDANDHDDSGDG